MGYSEMACIFCDVCFAIARIRRADEPESAAWKYYGYGYITLEDNCSLEGDGCEFRVRDSGVDKDGHRLSRPNPKQCHKEHLAGPDCNCCNGYGGYRITLEELRGIREAICIAPKESNAYTPEESDQPFEEEGGWFLSGICKGVRDRECLGPYDPVPVRHGMDDRRVHMADEFNFGMGRYTDHGPLGPPMAVHTACLEIFTRMSRMRFGEVDLDSLGAWRTKIHVNANHPSHSTDLNINRCSGQWWDHIRGTEYLAANPTCIPGYHKLLESCIKEGPEFDASTRPFSSVAVKSEMDKTTVKHDPMQRLPTELKLLIVDQLGAADLARARVAFRSLNALPLILWQRYVKEDFPWIWEAWDDTKLLPWSVVTANELETKYNGDILAVDVDKCSLTLPSKRTDWFELYGKVKKASDELNGLKNRRRIWNDMHQILDWMADYREQPSD